MVSLFILLYPAQNSVKVSSFNKMSVSRSDKFVSMATRTRQEYLKDLASNYATQTTIDSGSKFGEI